MRGNKVCERKSEWASERAAWGLLAPLPHIWFNVVVQRVGRGHTDHTGTSTTTRVCCWHQHGLMQFAAGSPAATDQAAESSPGSSRWGHLCCSASHRHHSPRAPIQPLKAGATSKINSGKTPRGWLKQEIKNISSYIFIHIYSIYIYG